LGAISGSPPASKRLPPIVHGEVAAILRREGGAHIAGQRMGQTKSRVVEGAGALNLSPKPNLQLVGVHDGPTLCGHKCGEMH